MTMKPLAKYFLILLAFILLSMFIRGNLQRNSSYARNLSFIFINTVKPAATREDFHKYQQEAIGILHKNGQLYNLDKRGECRNITITLLNSYSKHVDAKIYTKQKYLQHDAKIEYNHKFLEDLTRYLKLNATNIYT